MPLLPTSSRHLRRSSRSLAWPVDASQGMITVADWVVVSKVVPKSACVLVLVPLELAVAAMELLGESPITKMVLSALGKLPDDWGSDEDEEAPRWRHRRS